MKFPGSWLSTSPNVRAFKKNQEQTQQRQVRPNICLLGIGKILNHITRNGGLVLEKDSKWIAAAAAPHGGRGGSPGPHPGKERRRRERSQSREARSRRSCSRSPQWRCSRSPRRHRSTSSLLHWKKEEMRRRKKQKKQRFILMYGKNHYNIVK